IASSFAEKRRNLMRVLSLSTLLKPLGGCVIIGAFWSLCCVRAVVWGAQDAAQPSKTAPKLDTAVRENLRRFSKTVDSNVTFPVLIASRRGQNETVAKQAVALGGKVVYRLDAVDYLRVRISAAGILALADAAEVEALDIADYLDDTVSWASLVP